MHTYHASRHDFMLYLVLQSAVCFAQNSDDVLTELS